MAMMLLGNSLLTHHEASPDFIEQCILPKDQVFGYYGPRVMLMV